MSEAVTALAGATAPGTVTIRDAGLRGMITLRGDLSDKKLRAIAKSLTGQAFPEPRTASSDGDTGLAWMSPDEVLVMVPYDSVADALAQIAKALKGTHHLAVNVSDARTVMRVEGPYAREVLAKLAPVDLHPASLTPGDFRRSRLGQVAAAFWMDAEAAFTVICFRSVGEYAFGLLKAAAEAGPVGHFPQG